MKPKDYIKKYNIEIFDHFDHSMFVADLTVDFQTQVEYQKSVGQYTFSHFENIVKQIKQKFDSISNKSKMSIEKWDKLWKFFYASIVVKVRDEDFGEFLDKQKSQKEEKRRENSWRYRTEYDFYAGSMFDELYRRFFKQFFGNDFGGDFGFFNLSSRSIPTNEFSELGLKAESCTIDDVNISFRKLALIHHPDKGGSASKFQNILEAKNRCIMYLQSK